MSFMKMLPAFQAKHGAVPQAPQTDWERLSLLSEQLGAFYPVASAA